MSNSIQRIVRDTFPNEDIEMIFTFLAVFSRFEYALKRHGFVKRDKSNKKADKQQDASADWDKFASEISSSFKPIGGSKLDEAVKYLCQNPPKKQITNPDSTLGLKEVPYDKDKTLVNNLTLIIGRIRNNLFHGGKYPLQPMEEPARNRHLLQSSLLILEELVDISNADIRSFMMEGL